MCFNLAQEQVVTNMTKLAIRFGMIKLDSLSSTDFFNAEVEMSRTVNNNNNNNEEKPRAV